MTINDVELILAGFMNEKSGENLLLGGQQLREGGKTLEAVAELNAAMTAFIKEGDFSRYAHALLDRCICWQHLCQENGDPVFAILHQADAWTMLKIAEEKNIPDELCQAYFINGKTNMLKKDYAEAAEFFRKAIEKIPPERLAQKGDWLTNLGKAEYLAGQKDVGRQDMLDGIEQIKKHMHEIDPYMSNVWLSGGYLRLAEVLKDDDKNASDGYLSQARQIIESDQTQIIRRKNLAKFEQTGETDL